MKKILKRLLALALLLAAFYFFPIFIGIYLLLELYDVLRNKQVDIALFKQYFFVNGLLTWLISPFNTFLDILSLPFINKGVYKLGDLPEGHQKEIKDLIATAESKNIPALLDDHCRGMKRAMFFFKWYGRDYETSVDIPEFNEHFKYIRTVGISMFKERESTSRHFGPFRPTLRVLYCLNDITDDNVFIEVGPIVQKWKDEKLFIFDDTLQHRSVNESDADRYVIFVDILRPTYLPFAMDAAVNLIRLIFERFNGIFYKNWNMVTKTKQPKNEIKPRTEP